MINKKTIHIPNSFYLMCSCLFLVIACTPETEDYTRFVDPFIGTQHEGHTFPGATAPLGMVQVSPESHNEFYHYLA